MGMGEPFLNPEGVLPALDVLFEILPPRRVTVSTSGITPAFALFAALPRRPNLAVSLNAADDETRSALMPINRTYPLEGLLRALAAWPLEPRRRITIEYVAIAGRNDSTGGREASRAAPARPEREGQRDPAERGPRLSARMEETRTTPSSSGSPGPSPMPDVPVTVRRSRGPDASAACGQLKGRTVDPRKRVPAPRS